VARSNIKNKLAKIIRENPDKDLSELFSEYKEFGVVTNDEDLSRYVTSVYEEVHSVKDDTVIDKKPQTPEEMLEFIGLPDDLEPEPEPVQRKDDRQAQQEEKDELIKLIKEQQKIILDQQKKIQDHDQKLNDIINIFQTFMSNPNAILEMVGAGTQQAAQQQEQEQPTKQEQPNPQQAQQPKQNTQAQQAMLQRQQAVNTLKGVSSGGAPFDFNRLQDVLKSVAIITSNLGQRQQASPMDIIGNITNSVDIATTIASSIGEGLGKLFDTFNKMQDRAFKSWALKSKGVAEDDIEKLLEQKLEEKLNSLINRSGGS